MLIEDHIRTAILNPTGDASGWGRVLIIPDVHQDIAWVQAILEKEAGQWDQLLFLGDYFDSFKKPPEVATAVETAEFLLELDRQLGPKLSCLLGNHDIPYYEVARKPASAFAGPALVNQCAGFQAIASANVAELLGKGFFQSCALFASIHGWLISHAGVHPSHWRGNHPGIEDPLAALEAHCDIAMEYFDQRRMAILSPGLGRSGPETVGGITWLDWRSEFVDDLHLPRQIAGHTLSLSGPQWKGRSVCIDGSQSCWAVLNADGDLSTRSFS